MSFFCFWGFLKAFTNRTSASDIHILKIQGVGGEGSQAAKGQGAQGSGGSGMFSQFFCPFGGFGFMTISLRMPQNLPGQAVRSTFW